MIQLRKEAHLFGLPYGCYTAAHNQVLPFPFLQVLISTHAPASGFHATLPCASHPAASSTALCATLVPARRQSSGNTWRANSTRAKCLNSGTRTRWRTLAMYNETQLPPAAFSDRAASLARCLSHVLLLCTAPSPAFSMFLTICKPDGEVRVKGFARTWQE